VDPEFQRVMTRVLIVGGAIGVIATGALVIAFRAFAAKTPRDKDFRGTILVGGVIAFVLLCCVALMFISLR
jgi:multisubunit Na+/H+ antiporter MnhB subunit